MAHILHIIHPWELPIARTIINYLMKCSFYAINALLYPPSSRINVLWAQTSQLLNLILFYDSWTRLLVSLTGSSSFLLGREKSLGAGLFRINPSLYKGESYSLCNKRKRIFVVGDDLECSRGMKRKRQKRKFCFCETPPPKKTVNANVDCLVKLKREADTFY